MRAMSLNSDVFTFRCKNKNKNQIVKIVLGNGQELIDADGYNLLYNKSLFHLNKEEAPPLCIWQSFKRARIKHNIFE